MSLRRNAEKEWIHKVYECLPVRKPLELAPTAGDIAGTDMSVAKAGRGFADVAGMDSLKQLVKEGFVNVLRNRECAEAFGVKPPSLLLYGPPGCGKTFIAEKIAEETGMNFIKVVPDDIASTFVHGTQEKIATVFRRAARQAPSIIFFDEFDAMVPHRSTDDNNHQSGETNEFLCMLNNASEKGIYVVAATNHPERIDRAVLRTGRIDELIYVDMPDAQSRESLFRLSLSKLPAAEDIDYARLAGLTQGYNCSDISYIVKMASRKMFNESIAERGKPYKVIRQELLEETISQRAPSVSSRDIREYERIRSEFSSYKDEGRLRPIGFC